MAERFLDQFRKGIVVKYETFEQEAKALFAQQKFQTMRESCPRYNILAWHLVICGVTKNTQTNDIIQYVIDNAIEIWGDDAKESLNGIGIYRKRDIADILIIAAEHGIIRGTIDEYEDGDIL